MKSEFLFKDTPHGFEFLVRLTPKASHSKIGEVIEDASGQQVLKVFVTAVPENNKANEALVKLLAKHLGVSKTSIEIISGHTDRNKRIRVI